MNEEKIIESQAEEYGFKGVIWEIVKMVFWVVVIIVPIRVFLIQPFFVQGASMEPNFEDKQYLIVNELGYKTTVDLAVLFTVKPFKELQRGDVVVFRYPKNPSVFYIKRIIGLPGEKIEISDDKVKIFNSENPNGFVLDESKYLSAFGDDVGRNQSDSRGRIFCDGRQPGIFFRFALLGSGSGRGCDGESGFAGMAVRKSGIF